MNTDRLGLANLVSRLVSVGGTLGPNGDGVVNLSSGGSRSVLKVSTLGGSQDLYVKYGGATAPSVAADDADDRVDADDASPWWGLSGSVNLWAWSATETTVRVIEGGY